MKTLHFLIFITLFSCAFESSEDEPKTSSNSELQDYQNLQDEDLKKLDTSGDQISDYQKIKLGLDPFIADLPKLRLRFLQNFKITVHWKSLKDSSTGKFEIDTKVGRDDPNFQYRVGEILVRERSLKEAARIGKFSTHHWGQITKRDLNWVSFPEIDPRFYHKNLLKYSKYFDQDKFEITNVQIELENTARLNSHPLYKSVKDLELSFYYYNYERETWEVIKNAVVERQFIRGQTETFKVVIENAPVDLIRDNFFSKGEFIISEVKNFVVDDKGVDLKSLMKSVKAKSTQVIINTPHDTRTLFVARPNKKIKIADILNSLYEKNFTIQSDEIEKIGAFENNLPSFTYLKEVRDKEKKGRWFVFTDRLRKHYLDYNFGPDEVVNLSYITGTQLAQQSSEKVHSLRDNISGGEDYRLYPLGNISANSSIDVQLTPKKRLGDKIKSWKDEARPSGGPCSGNCYRAQFHCKFKFNIFSTRDESFEFDRDYGAEINQLTLVINDNEYALKELIEEKLVSVAWREKNLHLKIKDIEKIQELNEARENVLFLKINTERGKIFEGLNLVSFSGRDKYECIKITGFLAGNNNFPIYIGSRDFSRWQGALDWGKLKRSQKRSYTKPFSIGVSSTINNFHN